MKLSRNAVEQVIQLYRDAQDVDDRDEAMHRSDSEDAAHVFDRMMRSWNNTSSHKLYRFASSLGSRAIGELAALMLIGRDGYRRRDFVHLAAQLTGELGPEGVGYVLEKVDLDEYLLKGMDVMGM